MLLVKQLRISPLGIMCRTLKTDSRNGTKLRLGLVYYTFSEEMYNFF